MSDDCRSARNRTDFRNRQPSKPDGEPPSAQPFVLEAQVDDRAEGIDMFAERDRTLAANRDGEYVLWFEADLYDQLRIIQILSRLKVLGVPAQQITPARRDSTASTGGLAGCTARAPRAVALQRCDRDPRTPLERSTVDTAAPGSAGALTRFRSGRAQTTPARPFPYTSHSQRTSTRIVADAVESQYAFMSGTAVKRESSMACMWQFVPGPGPVHPWWIQ